MVKISVWYDAFKVSISEPGTGWRGYSVKAKDLAEVKHALDHYYRSSAPVRMRQRERHTNDRVKACPLCRKKTK